MFYFQKFSERDMEKQLQLEQISQTIHDCKKCGLYQTRNFPMVGDGNINARIVLIGEAPGKNEDQTGKAFQGKAGDVLNELLEVSGLTRDDVYITNILKCRPPKNHDPSEEQIGACLDYLWQQLKCLQPQIIGTMGKFATREFFQRCKIPFTRISEMHGRIFKIQPSYGSVLVVSMYHPAVASYRPAMLPQLEKDFALIGTCLEQPRV
jgi:DNA polymerase